MPEGSPRAPITYSPPKPPLGTKRTYNHAGDLAENIPERQKQSYSYSKPSLTIWSGGVLGWLSGSKNLTLKEKTCSVFSEDANVFNHFQLL